jgi:hypothetical protein
VPAILRIKLNIALHMSPRAFFENYCVVDIHVKKRLDQVNRTCVSSTTQVISNIRRQYQHMGIRWCAVKGLTKGLFKVGQWTFPDTGGFKATISSSLKGPAQRE